MTLEELRSMLRKPGCKASNRELARQLLYEDQTHPPVQGSQPELPVQPKPVRKIRRATESAQRAVVVITSFRPQLLDPDNLCPKYIIDGLRYAGLLADDTSDCVEVRVAQVRCLKGEERTEVELVL